MTDWEVVAEWVRNGLALLALLFSLAAFFYKRSTRKEDQLEARLEEGKATMDALDERIDALELTAAALKERSLALPSAESMNRLSNAVTTLAGELKAHQERVTGIDRAVTRLESVTTRVESFLLNRGHGG